MSELLTGWIETRLGALVKIGRGSSPRPIHDYLSETGIPWVKIADATASNTRFIKQTRQFIREEGRSTSVVPGDFIVSNSATPGIPKIMAINACVHDGWLVFDDYKNVDKWFLFYFFLDFRKKLNHSASGTVFKNLKIDIVNDVQINLPPFTEQKTIASILSSFDEKIELLQDQNQTMENIAQTLFKRWFIDFEFPGEDGNPYKSSGGKMVESELGEIPEGWDVNILECIADISIGRTPPRKEEEWFSTNFSDVKWISIKDLGNSGIYIDTTTEYLTEEAVKRFNIPIIQENTVVLSFKLTVGRVSITTERMLSNEAIAHININSNRTSVEHMFLLLKSFNYVNLGSTSSIATAINSKTIKQMEILIPAENVIQEFSETVGSVFTKVKSNILEIQTLTKTRDSLLPKLMSGQIRVKN